MLEIFKQLISLEKKLHSMGVRHSKDQLDCLLADDFREIGRSGSHISKREVIARLIVSEPRKIDADNYQCYQLTIDIIQIIYQEKSRISKNDTALTLRSSLWKNNGTLWQMIFHQATVLS